MLPGTTHRRCATGFAITVAVFLVVCLAIGWWGSRVRHGSTGVEGHGEHARTEALLQHQRNDASGRGYF